MEIPLAIYVPIFLSGEIDICINLEGINPHFESYEDAYEFAESLMEIDTRLKSCQIKILKYVWDDGPKTLSH